MAAAQVPPPDCWLAIGRIRKHDQEMFRIYLLQRRGVPLAGHSRDVRLRGDSSSLDVTPQLDAGAARLFEKATERAVGKQLAIVLDREVLMTPLVLEPIRGGRVEFTPAREQHPLPDGVSPPVLRALLLSRPLEIQIRVVPNTP